MILGIIFLHPYRIVHISVESMTYFSEVIYIFFSFCLSACIGLCCFIFFFFLLHFAVVKGS